MADKKSAIKKVILKYEKLIPKNIIQRDLIIPELKFDKANVIVGPRRAGKTYYLYSLISNLNKKFVYVNFEDNLLPILEKKDLNLILECAKELYGNNIVFFFDEIQNVNDWENFIVSLLIEHYKVYITGSNSKLLSKEIATSLRGKSLSYILLPFSFKELVNYRFPLEKNWENTNSIYEIKKLYLEYFLYGGFPEVLQSKNLDVKNKLINNYFESVLYKDLVDRLNIKNLKLVDVTIKYLLNLFSNNFSISVFEKYLKSNKISYSLQDVYNILYSLQDIFLVYYIKEYSKSYKSEISKAKVYLFDLGYIRFISRESQDNGRILENLVFIELYRRLKSLAPKIFYFKTKNNFECDFVIEKQGKIINALQVTYELNSKNKDRELRGLIEALNKFNLNSGIVLTNDQEEVINIDNKQIYIKPIWKWLLKEEDL